MLLEKITNCLQGEVRLRVVSGFPERVLNLCSERDLAFWDVCWISPTEFLCTVSRKDWGILHRAAEKLDGQISVEKRRGIPFFLGHLRRRHVLLAGLTLCALALFLGSFFIWDFTIEGNTTVTDEEILRALEKNGVTIGTFGFSVDGENLRNHVLLEVPKLSWIAVNVYGCQARVQVRERTEKPELADKRTPCNLVARRDGLVTKVQALDGEKLVLPGTTVQAGQILISGVEDTDTFGARLLAGMGEVWARTWYTLHADLPLTVQQKINTGEEHTRFSLIFGTKRVKFYGNGSYYQGNYDKITERTPLHLLGLALPVTAETETYRAYTVQEQKLSAVEMEKRGKALLTDYLQTLLGEDSSIRSTLCTSRQKNGVLTVTLTAECLEQIGVQQPVLTETKDSGR